MTADSVSGVEIFFSYAREDERLREQLEKHLYSLSKKQDLSVTWHHRQIVAGTERAQEIDAQLESASIILLLISADFLNSDYCYGSEMRRALERNQRGEAHVIPVILRPADWHNLPFAHLQRLPSNGQAITTWSNRDEAFNNVAEGIRKIVEEISFKEPGAFFHLQLQSERQKRDWTQADLAQKIDVSRVTIQRWERGEAFPSAHMRRKLDQLFGNKELLLALSSSTQKQPSSDVPASSLLRHLANSNPLVLPVIAAISKFLSPSQWVRWCYTILGKLFLALKLYKKAITVYENALLTEPLNVHLHIGKGEALLGLSRSNEALAAYERAIHLSPDSSAAYKGQGKAFEQLAQQAFDEVSQQAQQCYEKAKQLGIE